MGSSFPEPSSTILTPETSPSDRGGWTLAILLASTFAIRAIHPDQPIVENYVGRQVPTAMVARNLSRGSGFLRPELDTGPFPNLFLVEPPVYAWVVSSFHWILGLDRGPTGRLVSAAATTLGAWGLFGLVRRREGREAALLAVAAFAAFPVMIRYGRAFQPDALMLGFVLAGLRGWDEFESTGRRDWAIFGGFVLATGLTLKVTSAWVLIPFVLIVRRRPMSFRLGMGGLLLVPALAWYLYAWGDLARPSTGSLASSDNAAIWLRTLDPSSWLRPRTWSNLAQALTIRSFTPVGFVLAAVGFLCRPRLDRLWVGWGVGCGLAILGLASKWHHAYYWMVVSPLAAVGVARGLRFPISAGSIGRGWAMTLGSSFLSLCAIQSASTFRTPEEWADVEAAAREIQSLVPPDAGLIAPEALLFLSDRRGFRLEFDPAAKRRAAGELGQVLPDPEDPLALVDLYVLEGGPIPRVGDPGPNRRFEKYPARVAGYVADSGIVREGSPRSTWRAAIRARPNTTILVDRPGLFLARLR